MAASITRRFVRRCKRRWRYLLGKEPYVKVQRHRSTQYLGSDYGGWEIIPSLLNDSSVVYSFGVGEDISFDLGMISEFGCSVHAFDPTPRSIEWLKRQTLPELFQMHEFGLACEDGELKFRRPSNPNHVSHSAVDIDDAMETISLPVRAFNSICSELGHSQIDVLKMDIEGSEYDVLDGIKEWSVPVKQLLVEFHHRFAAISLERTRTSLKVLDANGYVPYWLSDTGEELGFIHKDYC